MIDTSTWQSFKLKQIFSIHYGVNLELQNCESCPQNEGVNFIGRSANNNGVTGRVRLIDGIEPEPKGAITVAGGGSVLSTFLQPEPFYSGRDLFVLISRDDKISPLCKLFLCTLIQKESYRYSYGKQANKDLPDIRIKLPVDQNSNPDWVWIENFMKLQNQSEPVTKNTSKDSVVDTSQWKPFKISNIFTLKTGLVSHAGELEPGDSIWYLGAKRDDNGLMNRVAYNSDLTSEGNCVVFICDGQGSVGYANYMDQDFLGTVNLTLGYNDNLNKYSGIFIATVASLERPRYSYGRKWGNKVADTIIKLPATAKGEPDWQYMENYIKSLPYGDCL